MNEISVKEVTFDEIRAAIKELTDSQKETNRLMREGDLEVDRQFKEIAQQFKETGEQIKEIAEQSKKTGEQIREIAEQSKETGEQIKELSNLFTNQWGKLMESLVEGDLVKLLNERGIKVNKNEGREKDIWQGKEYEFDIVSTGDDVIVVTEVKTTLGVDDVGHFISKLKHYKEVFPKYANKIMYAAIAYLRVEEEAAKYAAKQGLLVIRATGSSASIINKKTFMPKVF